MIINAHTHQPSSADISVINFYPYQSIPEVRENDLLSAGLHPWFLKDINIDEALIQLEALCQNQKIAVVGECGLDKNMDNIEIQKNVFKCHIELSEKHKLPIVIHSVKTHHFILEMRNKLTATMPWLVHGFQGSKELALQFSSQNIFISFGAAIMVHPDKFQTILNQVDLDFVLFETDDKNISISEIYQQAAKLLNMPVGLLEKRIENNFKRWIG